jgi:hypothetical protein
LKQGANPNAESPDLADEKSTESVLELAITDPFATQADRPTCQAAVKMLIAHGAIFPGVKNENDQALLLAVAQGDPNKIQRTVTQEASINAREACGLTPLIISTALGYNDLTRQLVEHGAALNIHARNDLSPLLMAVKSQQADIVDFLLAQGAKPSPGGNELDYTIQRGDRPMFDTLLKAGAKPGDYSLIACIQNNRVDMARTLLDQGANPQPPPMKDMDNKGTVYWAVVTYQPEILKMLLDHGADPTWKTTSGQTPLSLVQQSHPDMVPLLKEAINRTQAPK